MAAAPAYAQPEPDRAEAARREPLRVALDWTLGFGKVGAVDQGAYPDSNQRAPTPKLTDAQIAVGTWIVGARYDVTPDVTAGVRLPFSLGNLGRINYGGGHTVALGNVELSGEVRRALSTRWAGAVSLALALPTSLGTELPTAAQLAATAPEQYDPAEANKFATNQAAAAAFGYREDALFWSKRFGLTPGVAARWTGGRLHASAFFAAPSLFDTHAASAEPYRMELVIGGGGGYAPLPWLDFGLEAWGSAAPVRRVASPVGAVVLSPEARLRFGARHENAFYVAGVLPLAGSSVDPYYFGALRAGIAGTF